MLDLPPPAPSLEIVVASQGMSKGLRQTDGIQLVGRGELALGDVYVALLAKNVSSPVADAEAQAWLGYRTHAGGFELNASAGHPRPLRGRPAAHPERVQ